MNFTPDFHAAPHAALALTLGLATVTVVGFWLAFVWLYVVREKNRQGRFEMAQTEKRLLRMMHGEHEVTVLAHGRENSTIRNPWGFVVEVPSSDLEEIPDPEKRYLVVPVTRD